VAPIAQSTQPITAVNDAATGAQTDSSRRRPMRSIATFLQSVVDTTQMKARLSATSTPGFWQRRFLAGHATRDDSDFAGADLKNKSRDRCGHPRRAPVVGRPSETLHNSGTSS
jgi:hypothetical protein